MASLRNFLKKLQRHPLVATTALAGVLVAGELATNQHTADVPSPPARSEMDTYQNFVLQMDKEISPEFANQISKLFDISGTDLATQKTKMALFEMSGTPEGQKLLEDLNADQKIKISFSDDMDDSDYGQANPKKEGFPLELNSQLAQNDLNLIDTLFHELCHVRQMRKGVGNLSDLPMEKYDLSIASEAEARLMSSLMVSHLNAKVDLSQIGNNWMEQASVLDGLVYNSVKSGLMTKDKKLSEETAGKKAKEEVLKSIVSGQNTPMVNTFISEHEAQQFEFANHKWLYSYSLGAGAQAYDDFYPTMHPDSLRANELIDSIAQRLGVDRESLLSPTGVDLKNVQRDDNGNILSAEQVSRGTQEDLGIVKSSYDDQSRVLHRTELNPDNSVKNDRVYTYGDDELPVQLQENGTTISYDNDGKRTMEQSDDRTVYYTNGQITKEILRLEYSTTETNYKNYKVIDYVHRLNDGTIVDEYHEKPESSQGENNTPFPSRSIGGESR
ncbi:MAG: hypothetical protein II938_00700 [Alphaproteobacteria bacterium]|nr:hypothetical protein [Alphaproteobacteria bacterium]MBQ7551475.1 hypothetical protein [Bacteroidales bacterium]